MAENEYGELVPSVDRSKCNGCGLCGRMCPQLEAVELLYPDGCYAAWAIDPSDRKGSSSGGIGHLLALGELERGGVVIGCAMGRDGRARHIVVDSTDGLSRLRGSKYVQSDASGALAEARRLLADDREVLFVGTPCQVAAMRNLAGGRSEKLYSVDLICHGAPPARYLIEHLRDATGLAEFDSVTFRDGPNYVLRAQSDGFERCRGALGKDPYVTAFMCGDIFRESCYSCRYARSERVGDLTIGDFWGLDRSTLGNRPPQAVSVVLQNTDRGAELVRRLNGLAVLKARDPQEAVAGNDQLREPSRGTGRRDAFRRNIASTEFDAAVKKSGLARDFLVKRVKGSKALAPLRAVKHALKGRG